MKQTQPPVRKQREAVLTTLRNSKMARSAHAYVRGNTLKFYEWLDETDPATLPVGPAVWICGDCHVGNLGPVADSDGKIEIQIRDFDQTVIGNPAHDLIRLGLSLATAVRSSALPGVTTAKMIEQMVAGYSEAFAGDAHAVSLPDQPLAVQMAMKDSQRRSWKHLARERMNGNPARLPLGKAFWPLAARERASVARLFDQPAMQELARRLGSRDDDAIVTILDAAYWRKGCSSLGLLRVAVLLDIGHAATSGKDMCLIDIKEAVTAAAPRYARQAMPRNNAQRVLAGAQHLSPHLGERMVTTELLERPVFIRELLPQDLKLEIERVTCKEAMRVARYLARVVGDAHARQMDSSTRQAWRKDLLANRSKQLDAPSWLWASVVELVAFHERGYLEHCRRYALEPVVSANQNDS